MTYAISPEGLALIQDAEGFRAEPAQLPDGNWVVGFGHVRVGDAGAPVTLAQAADLLVMDVAPVERMVNAQVTTPLTQSQFDALVSFAMSVGSQAFAQSQVLRRVNNAEHFAAACALDAWRKADVDGALEVLDVLVRRRAAEKALYLKDVAVKAAPSVFVRAQLDHAASVLGAPIAFASTPAMTYAPAPVAVEPVARLVEILKSEPATEALLLTNVVLEDEESDEIVTAHAKPAARPDAGDAAAARDYRLSKIADEPKLGVLDRLAARFNFSKSFETVGLVALVLFGLGLTLVAVSLLVGHVADAGQLMMAASLGAPGLAAIGLGAFALARGGAEPSQA